MGLPCEAPYALLDSALTAAFPVPAVSRPTRVRSSPIRVKNNDPLSICLTLPRRTACERVAGIYCSLFQLIARDVSASQAGAVAGEGAATVKHSYTFGIQESLP